MPECEILEAKDCTVQKCIKMHKKQYILCTFTRTTVTSNLLNKFTSVWSNENENFLIPTFHTIQLGPTTSYSTPNFHGYLHIIPPSFFGLPSSLLSTGTQLFILFGHVLSPIFSKCSVYTAELIR
jgi:hypothetical protein